MNFREIVKASGYDPTKATGKVPRDVLCQLAEQAARSGEPLAITERRVQARKQTMLEDLKRAISQRKIFLGNIGKDTR